MTGPKRRSKLRKSKYSKESWIQQILNNGKNRDFECLAEGILNKPWNALIEVGRKIYTWKQRPIWLQIMPRKNLLRLNHKEVPSKIIWYSIKTWANQIYLNLKRNWRNKKQTVMSDLRELVLYLRIWWCSNSQDNATLAEKCSKRLTKVLAKHLWINKQPKVWRCWINTEKLLSFMKKMTIT